MGKLIAVASLVVVAMLLVTSLSLMPSSAEAAEKGTSAPLVLTWIMIGGTLLSGVVLAGFLFRGNRS